MKLRSVNTSFWSDPFIEDLSPSEKLLYLYLITNDKTNMLGIYEVSIKKISFDTGIDKGIVQKALEGFERLGKVKYIDNYIILTKYLKHQSFNTNMKKSAIDCYNDLPQSLKFQGVTISKDNPLEGFETLLKHYGILSKVEVEVEYETEYEIKKETKKTLMSEANASDLSEKNRPFFEMANGFYLLFKQNASDLNVNWLHLKKAKAEEFTNHIRLMIEQDGRDLEELREVWGFLKKDQFWKENIQSTKKLRDKFDQLITKARNNGKQTNGRTKELIKQLSQTDAWKEA